MSKFIEQTSAVGADINRVSVSLRNLALAFERTGNKEMYEELTTHADTLSEAEENLSKAVTEEINRGWKKSQEMSKTILETALASGKGK